MKALSTWMYRVFNTRVMIIAIVIFVLFTAIALPMASKYAAARTGTDTSPDTSLIYSSDDLYSMAEDYGAEGRRAYVVMRFTFDLFWPIIYLFFMASVTTRLFSIFRENSKLRLLNLLPFMGTLFDYLENVFAAIVIGRFPLETPVAAKITPIFTVTKWILLGLGFILILILIVYRLYKWTKVRAHLNR